MSGGGKLTCFASGDTCYGNCCGDVLVTYLTCGDTQMTCFRVDDTGCENHCEGWSVDMSNMSVDMSNIPP